MHYITFMLVSGKWRWEQRYVVESLAGLALLRSQLRQEHGQIKHLRVTTEGGWVVACE